MTYVIECITTDAPYISIGYVGKQGKFVGSLKGALRISCEEYVRDYCKQIRKTYNGDKYVSLMPFVYGITKGGKLGERFMELER